MKAALSRIRSANGFFYFLVVGALIAAHVENCLAANSALSRSDLTRTWNEQFPQPIDSTNTPTATLDAPALLPSVQQPDSYHPNLQQPSAYLQPNQPHPAVARIIVPEGDATSYGSGTLVDARDQFGLVITNWHVVRDSVGVVEVLFPDGFKSKARALKVDADWDLAALVIWRPQVDPVVIAQSAPQPGDQLTICGYGQGMYRSVSGRCTQYYAPRLDFPRHMVELDVEARQGDSGGPIFNSRGELAGVLFGAGQGTTMGSFGGRVESFLATLAPDIGHTADVSIERGDLPPPPQTNDPFLQAQTDQAAVTIEPHQDQPSDWADSQQAAPDSISEEESSPWQSAAEQDDDVWAEQPPTPEITREQVEQLAALEAANLQSGSRSNLFEQIKTGLAVIGVMALAALVLRAAR